MADLQLKRGTTLKHSTFTGKVGEVTVDTDKDTLVVHDNSTVGGFPLARESVLNTHTARTDNPHVVTKAQVGLTNVDNTSDLNKPISTATQSALNLKANLASPTFTGIVSGITKSMVGLGSVDNTADTAKPVSTAQATAIGLKANIASPTFTGIVTAPTFSGDLSGNAATATTLQTARTINGVSFNGSANITVSDSTKAPLANPVFTGGSITIPVGTTAQRPSSPANGMTRFNTTTNTFETYVNNGWQPFDQYAYTNIQAFTSSSTFTVPAGVTKLQVLVVAGGGGGGGYYYAGGGGAGGLIFERNYKVTPAEVITATVGSGGATQSTNGVSGNPGNNSVFGTLTAIAGGGGGGGNHQGGGSGGSGGGCGPSGTTIGLGGACTNSQGSNGGATGLSAGVGGGGGGGGAGKPGTDTISSTNSAQYGHGGNGLYIQLFSAYGASGYFAGGGGGAYNANAITTGTSLGGVGGGGNAGVWNGGNSAPAPVNGTVNTGGGGGGAMHISNGTHIGAAGGSGVILIAWYQ